MLPWLITVIARAKAELEPGRVATVVQQAQPIFPVVVAISPVEQVTVKEDGDEVASEDVGVAEAMIEVEEALEAAVAAASRTRTLMDRRTRSLQSQSRANRNQPQLLVRARSSVLSWQWSSQHMQT